MASRNQALYTYEKVVRNAFSEVNNALDAIRQGEAQREALQKQEQFVAEALRIATNRYQNGYASYLDELDAQRTLFATQLNLVTVKNNLLQAQIALYSALGGAGRAKTRVGHGIRLTPGAVIVAHQFASGLFCKITANATGLFYTVAHYRPIMPF